MNKIYTVQAFWDDEAKVWCAQGVDVPGLCTYGSSIEHLMEKLNVMIPELLEASGSLIAGEDDIPFKLLAETSAIAHRSNA
jgi:predicted RNase H-like HicB family nuclease